MRSVVVITSRRKTLCCHGSYEITREWACGFVFFLVTVIFLDSARVYLGNINPIV